jgi:UDP-N-acetylglucosamine--N-acetylmuramyl-(pentapeptide) pyrophosphoryl-undecaprenol N-acetylglucosamine transferase
MPELVEQEKIRLDGGIDMREYIYDMPTVMAAADVIISRAGASTLNEIGASGTPCVLIPSPNVTNDHQTKNAKILADRGGAVLLTEQENMGALLMQTVSDLLADSDRMNRMSKALKNLVVVDSAERICDIIETLVQKKGG